MFQRAAWLHLNSICEFAQLQKEKAAALPIKDSASYSGVHNSSLTTGINTRAAATRPLKQHENPNSSPIGDFL